MGSTNTCSPKPQLFCTLKLSTALGNHLEPESSPECAAFETTGQVGGATTILRALASGRLIACECACDTRGYPYVEIRANQSVRRGGPDGSVVVWLRRLQHALCPPATSPKLLILQKRQAAEQHVRLSNIMFSKAHPWCILRCSHRLPLLPKPACGHRSQHLRTFGANTATIPQQSTCACLTSAREHFYQRAARSGNRS